MICRAKGCKNIAIDGEMLCGYCSELVEDGEALPLKKMPKNAASAERWAIAKAQNHATRDHAKEIVLQIISKRRENGPKLCAAKVKKGTMDCHFHATHGNFCYIHKSLAEG